MFWPGQLSRAARACSGVPRCTARTDRAVMPGFGGVVRVAFGEPANVIHGVLGGSQASMEPVEHLEQSGVGDQVDQALVAHQPLAWIQ